MANGSPQSKHLFTVIPHDLGLMPHFEHGIMKIVFGLSASGDGIVSDGGNVLLAVYDLDQYIQHQLDVPNGNGDFDIGTFNGAKSTFLAPLQDHEVKPGSGVLLLAQLSMSKHPNANNSTENWVVSQVISKEEIQAPAFELSVQMMARIDDSGNNAPLSPIQYQTVGIAGPATPDFSTFTHTKGGHRKLAIRFLSSDSTTVLLSQLNVVDCAAASSLLIRYADNGRRPNVGQPSPGLQSVLPKPSRVPPFDPTGLYVERLPPFDKPADPDDIDAPGTLWVHQVGRTVVGWYNPLPSLILGGNNPNTAQPFFSSSQQAQVLSQSRICFLATPNVHSWGLQFLQKKPKDNALHIVALTSPTSPGAGDDPDLLNQVDAASQFAKRLQAGWIQLHNTGNDALAPSITVSLSDAATPSVFVRASSHPKLSFELEALLNNTLTTNITNVDAKTLAAISSGLRSQFVEPLPPKILSELMRGMIGPAMIAAVVHWRAATDALNVSEQRVAEIEIDNALNNIAVPLAASSGGVIPDELIAQVRGMARTSTVLSSNIDGAQNVSILDTLESAMGEIVNRDIRGRTNDTSSLPAESDYAVFFQTSASRFPGFIAFGIRPAGSFTYKLSFTALDAASAEAIVVKGSVGGFVLTIDKIDDLGKIDPLFIGRPFVGVMLSGGVGIKLEFKPLSKKFFKPSGSGSVADCEIKTFLNLAVGDFRFARMAFFAQALPGISISASPGIGVKSGSSTTVVSITLPVRIPTAILETTVKSGDFLKPKATTPDIDSVKGALEKWKKALKSGKAEDVPTVQVSVSLYRLSLCVAIIVLSGDETPTIRPDGKLLNIDKLIDQSQSATLLMRGAEFPINSAFVSEKAHQLLEARLAVQRKLLEYQGGFMDIQGTTSPEWAEAQQGKSTPEKARDDARTANLKLSKARAEAVRDAIFASVGRPGQGIIDLERDIKALGFGPDPFDPNRTPAATQPGGLSFTDPFAPTTTKAQVALEQATRYPLMRHVDIQMNGAFTVRLKGAVPPVDEKK